MDGEEDFLTRSITDSPWTLSPSLASRTGLIFLVGLCWACLEADEVTSQQSFPSCESEDIPGDLAQWELSFPFWAECVKPQQSPSNECALRKAKYQSLSCLWLFATPWTIANQASLSMGFPRQESWTGLPCPPPGDLPDPGIKPTSLVSPLVGRFFTTVPPIYKTLLIQGRKSTVNTPVHKDGIQELHRNTGP